MSFRTIRPSRYATSCMHNFRHTVGFKYRGHKVFGDFGQMSLVPGWTFFSILLDLNHRKLTKNIFILYLNMRQASCMLVYDLISWFSRLETVVAIEKFNDKNTKKEAGSCVWSSPWTSTETNLMVSKFLN